ncbi:MAG TPA: dihydrolipoyl dehydrogenase [Candidatus Baltobacteraceae bacterium]|jgi:pyruvate/2-oxoglutarate dehydrogenase complex dihydrolipoamide dehydrogenase (E3) component
MNRVAYDLVVVGAGSGGYAAARTARELGATVALVDKGPLGGLCILRGCMPSKTLLASSDALHDVRQAGELGVRASGIAIDVDHIVARKRELIKGFADYRVEGIETFPVYMGDATFLSPTEVQVGDDTVLEGKKFVVATGSVIATPAVPGLDEAGYFDSDAALDRATIPKRLIVLGGGYVACELGQYFARMGARTTMIIRAPHLLSGADRDIGEALTGYFRDEGIEVVSGAQLVRVEKNPDGSRTVHVSLDGVPLAIETDEIFNALGRTPNVEGLGLERAGVDVHPKTGITIDDTMRTSNENIFAVGDVTGQYALVHVAIYQGEIAARNAFRGGCEKATYDLVRAHTVFSEPQVAVVGMTERELERDGAHYVVGRYEFAEHGKAMTLGRTQGFVKMMADPDDGRILGAAVIGPYGSELIHEMIVAMNYRATVQEFMRIPHLHPTLAEIWTYPAEECAEQIGKSTAMDQQMEIATSAHVT